MSKTKLSKWAERIVTVISSAVAGFILMTILYFCLQTSEWSRKAKEKEGLSMLNSIYVWSKATENEVLDYISSGYEEFSLENQVKEMNEYSGHYRIHINTNTMSANLKKKIPQKFHPFVEKKRFMIITVRRDTERAQYHCCALDQNKNIMCDYF